MSLSSPPPRHTTARPLLALFVSREDRSFSVPPRSPSNSGSSNNNQREESPHADRAIGSNGDAGAGVDALVPVAMVEVVDSDTDIRERLLLAHFISVCTAAQGICVLNWFIDSVVCSLVSSLVFRFCLFVYCFTASRYSLFVCLFVCLFYCFTAHAKSA